MNTKDLQAILDRIPTWPKDAQDELVRSVTEIETRYTGVYRVTDEDREALERSAEDIRMSRFAKDSDVGAVFSRSRRA